MQSLKHCHACCGCTVCRRQPQADTQAASAGWWKPASLQGAPDAQICLWGAATFEHLLAIQRSSVAADAGVTYITAHCLYSEALPSAPPWAHIVHNFRHLSGEECARMGHGGMAGARAFESLVADPTYFMPWLQAQLQQSGDVEFEQRKLGSLQEVGDSGDFDAVFNCTGALLLRGRVKGLSDNHRLLKNTQRSDITCKCFASVDSIRWQRSMICASMRVLWADADALESLGEPCSLAFEGMAETYEIT